MTRCCLHIISEAYVVLYIRDCCYCRGEEGTEKWSFTLHWREREMATPTIFALWGGAFEDPFFNVSSNIPLQSTRKLLLLARASVKVGTQSD